MNDILYFNWKFAISNFLTEMNACFSSDLLLNGCSNILIGVLIYNAYGCTEVYLACLLMRTICSSVFGLNNIAHNLH